VRGHGRLSDMARQNDDQSRRSGPHWPADAAVGSVITMASVMSSPSTTACRPRTYPYSRR
jgi:hypothetical protein